MKKDEVIKFWQAGARDNLKTAGYLFDGKRYSDCLFFCHLSLEKYLKSKVVEKTGHEPPPIHNLIRLAELADLKLDTKTSDYLAEINTFNLEARYDSYKQALFKKATFNYTKHYLIITKQTIQWLKKTQ